MASILQGLVTSLQSVSLQLKRDDIQAALHSTEKLTDHYLSSLASEALDLLNEVRLLLEPGHVVLADHFLGYMNTKALCASNELHVPDVLRSGSKTLPDLAIECNAQQDRLRQVMRTLHNNGIFHYDAETDSYRNNHTSTLLLSDHWTQWKNWVELYGNHFYDMARGIPSACRNGIIRSPAQVNFNTDDSMFKYFTDQGWAHILHKTLSGGAIAQAPGILEDYPWEEVGTSTVIDIGGGSGGLVASLLRRHKAMTGAILDTPEVIAQAKFNFHNLAGEYVDVGDRVPPENLSAGDFFRKIPAAEVYMMKWCLHDWNDDKVVVILKNIRKAIRKSPRSRLIILESVLRDGHMGRMSRYADLNMMVAVSGKERDQMQWSYLAEQTGWELRQIFPLRNAWPSAIEYIPVWTLEGTPQVKDPAPPALPQHVVASLRFLEPWNADKGNPYLRIQPAPGFDRMNFKWQDYSVSIQDARNQKGQFSLDIHGFAFFDDEISQEVVTSLRGNDKHMVKELYYSHVEEFVRGITGARRIIIFDHTLRKRRPELGATQNDDGKEQPATMVHCDQSTKGALARLKMNIHEQETVDDVLQNRVQIINVWRPLNGPVLDWPLALMDYQTASSSDMYPCDLLRGEHEERGQTATFTYSDKQRWYYLDKQKTTEVTVIKIWDSLCGGTSKFCAHAAFNHPGATSDVEPRESVEVRCIVIS